MLALLQVFGLHIGAFGPPFRPPTPNVVVNGIMGRIVPTRDTTFLSCMDPNNEVVHHFVHTNFHLNRCIWSGTPGDDTKAIIFESIRNWSAAHAGVTLKANFTDVYDLNAWYQLY